MRGRVRFDVKCAQEGDRPVLTCAFYVLFTRKAMHTFAIQMCQIVKAQAAVAAM